MSKWTLIRKTQPGTKCSLQNLWEGCFKMKGDHRKTEGETRSDFQKHIVKVQTENRAKRR